MSNSLVELLEVLMLKEVFLDLFHLKPSQRIDGFFEVEVHSVERGYIGDFAFMPKSGPASYLDALCKEAKSLGFHTDYVAWFDAQKLGLVKSSFADIVPLSEKETSALLLEAVPPRESYHKNCLELLDAYFSALNQGYSLVQALTD